jgi:hypothetical protein
MNANDGRCWQAQPVDEKQLDQLRMWITNEVLVRAMTAKMNSVTLVEGLLIAVASLFASSCVLEPRQAVLCADGIAAHEARLMERLHEIIAQQVEDARSAFVNPQVPMPALPKVQ